MCGIVGYIGERDIESILIVGLERLSYRGYDSAGIATIYNNEMSHWKKPGKIHELSKILKPLSIKGNIGIGHTRWATHGEPNQVNSHPHLSQNNKIAIVHNGIIENFNSLKNKLKKEGHIFRSDTDTEVIVHLIERYYTNNLLEAVEKTILDLVGTFAISIISELHPDQVIVCRKGSPLIIGIGKNENFISSDINALLPHTKKIVYMEDDEIAMITKEKISYKKLNGPKIKKKIETVSWNPEDSEKSGFPHYMLKEINEQPTIVRNIISKMVNGVTKMNFKHMKITNKDLAQVSRFIIQACGTSWHAGLYARYLLEKYAHVLTEVDISSEFRYRKMISAGNEIVVALSQSGETADTLACIREAKSKFFKILSFVNVKESSIDRESDAVIYTYAGQEIGVASTKNFLAQLICVYLFTVHISHLKWTISEEEAQEMLVQLKKIPDYIEHLLHQEEKIKKLAKKYYKSKQFIFIGRGVNYPSALEGALKLKEISYIHATGYPAGELKHGPIALIDENLPVVCICPKSETYEKMISNIQEVKARKGQIITVATEGDTQLKDLSDDIITIPDVPEELSPILVTIPLQLLAYHIAVLLECNVDQPRNLAKSVTVE